MSAVSWRTRRSPTRTTCCSWMFLEFCCTLTPAEEQTGSPGSGHHYANTQALTQGTWQGADRMWPVQIPVGGGLCDTAWKYRKPIHFLQSDYIRMQGVGQQPLNFPAATGNNL